MLFGSRRPVVNGPGNFTIESTARPTECVMSCMNRSTARAAWAVMGVWAALWCGPAGAGEPRKAAGAAAPSAESGDRAGLADLDILGEDCPRAFFFRASEGFAANGRIEYPRWERAFGRRVATPRAESARWHPQPEAQRAGGLGVAREVSWLRPCRDAQPRRTGNLNWSPKQGLALGCPHR